MPVIETKPHAGHDRAADNDAALALGEAAATAEKKALELGTNRIYRVRLRHPFLYGLTAFILGGGFVSIFTMTTYENWAYEGINLTTAVYQVVLGGLCGGLVAVMLAFVYAGSIRRTREPMKRGGIIEGARRDLRL